MYIKGKERGWSIPLVWPCAIERRVPSVSLPHFPPHPEERQKGRREGRAEGGDGNFHEKNQGGKKVRRGRGKRERGEKKEVRRGK